MSASVAGAVAAMRYRLCAASTTTSTRCHEYCWWLNSSGSLRGATSATAVAVAAMRHLVRCQWPVSDLQQQPVWRPRQLLANFLSTALSISTAVAEAASVAVLYLAHDTSNRHSYVQRMVPNTTGYAQFAIPLAKHGSQHHWLCIAICAFDH